MRQASNKPSQGKNHRDSRVTEQHRFRDFLAPVFWPTWLAIAGLYLMAWLPLRARRLVSWSLARMLYHLVASRRKIAQTNIRLCFPELNASAQQRLVRAVFYSNILNYFETALAWCRPNHSMQLEVKGLEHLRQAQATGRGVLLLSGHFGPIDVVGSLIFDRVDLTFVYRKDDNPLFNYFTTHARERYCTATLAHKDMKGILRALKGGAVVWYAADQDYGREASVFVPFFGVPTATITMTSKLARRAMPWWCPLVAIGGQMGVVLWRPLMHRWTSPVVMKSSMPGL